VVAAAVIAVGALVASFVGGGTGPTARAADPPGQARGLQPAGVGEFRGDIRHIPHGNLGLRGPRPEPRSPFDPLRSASGGDPAVQTQPALSQPATGSSFDGLSFANDGAGWPPDPNADVGPNYVVETVNTSIGFFDKSGHKVTSMSFDDLFTGTGTPCDNDNQGDPVALYDPFGDAYIVSDFAWTNFSSGPFYQCFAVSKGPDPLTDGWTFYAYEVESGSSIPDYPKFGVWPDGLYMSANVFSSTGAGSFQHVQVWAFDRTAMERGDLNARSVTFNLPTTVGGVMPFSLLPSNARAVTGSPPSGSPNLFASIYGSYAIRVWKFHVDFANVANSTFTGPTNVSIATFNVGPSGVPEQGGNNIDTLSYRLMMQNQYTNIGGKESLWLTHTVGSTSGGGIARVRWYELPVTGGSISAVRQQSTFAPDSLNRFMPSLAVDKTGNMAIGYSVSSGTMHPALRYSGRLAGDSLNNLTQAEQTIVQGAGFQCCKFGDGSTNTRWGDYSSMTIDPDGCTFWYTGEYYDAQPTTLLGDNWQTRIGHFQLPGCTSTTPVAPVVSGFSPASGPPETAVTINGSGFTGATSVRFNSTATSFSVNSTSSITASVPAGATTGPISVTTGGGTGTSSGSFTVTAPAAPTITSFTPASGPVGTSVTITGSGFTGATSVTFNGATASFAVNSSTQVTATVPAGATSGTWTEPAFPSDQQPAVRGQAVYGTFTGCP
jgi:hypothetical protein